MCQIDSQCTGAGKDLEEVGERRNTKTSEVLSIRGAITKMAKVGILSQPAFYTILSI